MPREKQLPPDDTAFYANHRLPSCHVTKNWLLKFEDDFVPQLAAILKVPAGTLRESYSLVLRDNMGRERFKSIRQYPDPLFCDSTSYMMLSLKYESESEYYEIYITLTDDGKFADAELQFRCPNSRGLVATIIQRLQGFFADIRKPNWMLSPPCAVNGLFIAPLMVGGTGIFLMMFGKPLAIHEIVAIVCSVGWFVWVILSSLNPYITFESVAARRNRLILQVTCGFLGLGAASSLIAAAIWKFLLRQ